jgi:hypothetical protein
LIAVNIAKNLLKNSLGADVISIPKAGFIVNGARRG